jgi:hypothetical protein
MKLIEGLEIIPYCREGNVYNLPDSYLGQVYRRIVLEATVHWIFYDGSVRNTSDFIDFLRRDERSVYFVKFIDEDVGFSG